MAIREAAPPAAELAGRDGPGRVCRVEPLGTIEDDPNVTDKRFPGNPTRSYRTTEPLRVLREITGRKRPPPEMIQHPRANALRQSLRGVNQRVPARQWRGWAFPVAFGDRPETCSKWACHPFRVMVG
jgi:hypothetical protein